MDDAAFLFIHEHRQARKDFSRAQHCVGLGFLIFRKIFFLSVCKIKPFTYKT